MLSFHLTPQTRNAKLGANVATTTTTLDTCPATCPHRLDRTCYAMSGPLSMHWAKVTKGLVGSTFPALLDSIRALPAHRLFRANQAGDIVDPGTLIGRQMLKGLVAATAHLKARWTYTHHNWRSRGALRALLQAQTFGFIVNVSCETEAQADEAIAAGLPAVLTVRSDCSETVWVTDCENVVTVCPEQTGAVSSCADCLLCAKPVNRRPIIAFKAHGRRSGVFDQKH